MIIIERAIEDIITSHPDLYLEHCAVMAVALMSPLTALSCEFVVECAGAHPFAQRGEHSFLLRVFWHENTALKAAQVQRTEQTNPIIERAAIALAALLFSLLPDGNMRVTRTGERADYWLPQLRCALEISGTRQARELRRREKEKRQQVLANPLRWDGYTVVCCFAAGHYTIKWAHYMHTEDVTNEPV